MKKRKIGRTLSRPKQQRIALLRTMLVSLTKYGRMKTTLAKAKELRPFAERRITRAKKAKGKEKTAVVLRFLKKDVTYETAKKLIELGKVFEKRSGGYIRIVKLPFRKSDGADMALVEWTEQLQQEEKPIKAGKKKEIVKKVKKEKETKKVEKKEENDKKSE
ncbi:MAG: 50S ribosomal protein L17 [Patescibacteria group bacterium]|nr:50S ribosomal protein L17 [Patescibacteria group bacterium]